MDNSIITKVQWITTENRHACAPRLRIAIREPLLWGDDAQQRGIAMRAIAALLSRSGSTAGAGVAGRVSTACRSSLMSCAATRRSSAPDGAAPALSIDGGGLMRHGKGQGSKASRRSIKQSVGEVVCAPFRQPLIVSG